MNAIESWVRTFLTVFDVAIQHGLGYSIIIGWVIAIGLTQWIKMLPWTSTNKWIIRLTALPFGFITTYSLWPLGPYFSAVRIFTSLAVGVSAPWIYQIITAVIRKFWPDIAERLSAEPKE